MLDAKLYIVATPIGNLEDMSFRAIRILKEADCIYAEDTQVSRKLLQHYKIDQRLISCNAQNEVKRIPEIIQRLKSGETVAIISDAGTPGISDPSVRLVSEARQHHIEVLPIPGPSALIAALSVAGLATDKFYFYGFLPNKKGRQTAMKKLSTIPSTIVLYESPYRVEKTLRQIHEFLGNRYIVIAREITKKFEEYYSGYIADILDKDELTIKGEFVLLIAAESFKR